MFLALNLVVHMLTKMIYVVNADKEEEAEASNSVPTYDTRLQFGRILTRTTLAQEEPVSLPNRKTSGIRSKSRSNRKYKYFFSSWEMK